MSEDTMFGIVWAFLFIGAYTVGWLKGHAEGRHNEKLEELSRRAKGL